MFEELLQVPALSSLLGILAGFLVIHLLYSSWTFQGKHTHPPGPRCLPLLGNLLQVDLSRLDQSLFKLSKKYGPVFTLHLGLKKIVVLAGSKTVRQALINHAEEFGDRESSPLFHDLSKGHGILFSNGDSWKETRRFTLTTLRDFGMGKRLTEQKIIEESHYLTEEFEKHKGKAFDTTMLMSYATSNIISAIVFGKRFDYKDPVLRDMVKNDQDIIHLSGTPCILVYYAFPWLGPWLQDWRDLKKVEKKSRQPALQLINHLKETFNPDICRCFVDAFWKRKLNLEAPALSSLLGILAGFLVIHLLYSSWTFQGKHTHPPGPRCLPLLGNLLQVDLSRLDQSLFKLSKRYGPVFTLHLGLKKMVVLAGSKTVRQALINHPEEFGDRETNPLFYDFNQGHGIIFTNGETWKEMRRFALATLRDFGMGKRLSERKIIEECQYLTEEFEKHEGKAFDTTTLISYAASNIISAIMFGKRFDYKDPVFQEMLANDQETVRLSGSTSILLYMVFPWLGPWLKNWRDLMRNVENNKQYLLQLINNLKETLKPDICRCFVDAFWTRKLNLEESDSQGLHYHDENLVYSVMNLFAAGTDTTSNTLRWGLLLMAKYPQIQDRVQEELSRVVGVRQVQMEDRKNLPYTDAVIHETQRMANIVPMSINHSTSRDVTFQGYFIEKGTSVLPLLTSVLYDETEWKTPNTFNPSHFLDEEGKFIRRDAFLPFSAGRRACLGEGLARMELFLFLTHLLQHFRFTPAPGISVDELDLTPVVGFTLSPPPHQLCAVSRH
uniref:cytochrome P450 2K1-like isoform X3 n=1 Tax=Doryrhamphus excisus TaxID=161450 RepID=UPI0025AE7933|nr:cytochrome P450 2K1-like isoform X3 [Doryrhamphus excisus]